MQRDVLLQRLTRKTGSVSYAVEYSNSVVMWDCGGGIECAIIFRLDGRIWGFGAFECMLWVFAVNCKESKRRMLHCLLDLRHVWFISIHKESCRDVFMLDIKMKKKIWRQMETAWKHLMSRLGKIKFFFFFKKSWILQVNLHLLGAPN